MTMLDANGSNTLTGQEFEDGLRDCRCVSTHHNILGGGVVGEGGSGRRFAAGQAQDRSAVAAQLEFVGGCGCSPESIAARYTCQQSTLL